MDNEEDISTQFTAEKTNIEEESKNAEIKEENNDKNEGNNNIDSKALETKKLKGHKRYSKNNTINYISPANEFQRTKLEEQNFMEGHEANLGITLNSLEEHWAYQNILLDYNILDFTSKYHILLIIIFLIK